MIAIKLDTLAVGVNGDDFPLTPASTTIHVPDTAGLLRFQQLLTNALTTLGEEGQVLKQQGPATRGEDPKS